MQKLNFLTSANFLRHKFTKSDFAAKTDLASKTDFSAKGEFALKKELILKKDEILTVIFGALCSFSTVFGSCIPFCASFYASSGFSEKTVLKFLTLAGSAILSLGFKQGIKYIVPMLIFTAASLAFPLKRTSVRAAVMSALLLLSGIAASYFDSFLLYDLVLCVTEAFVAFVGVFVLDKALPLITEYKNRTAVSQDEFVCITAFFAVCVFAFSRIPPVFGVHLSNILCILLILVTDISGEMGIGATIGVICGVASGVNNFNLSATVGAFAFSSMTAGFFKNYGKIGVSLGFILANTVITVFLNSSGEVLISVYEILAAVLLLFALPKRVFDVAYAFSGKISAADETEKKRAAQFKTVVKSKIYAMAMSLEHLADMYFTSEKTSADLEKKDLIAFFDTASKKVCADCSMRFNCWQHNYQSTYQHMLKMFSVAKLNGKILAKQLPDAFKETCVRQEEFCTAFNNMYELFSMSKFWKGKIVESKNAAAMQLKDLSKIIKTTLDTTDIAIDPETQSEIKVALDKRGIGAKFVWAVTEIDGGNFEITVCLKGNAEISAVKESVEEVLCKKVRLGRILSDNGDMMIKFYPSMKYSLTSASASIPKDGEEICGDACVSVPLCGGHMLAVSDGMGSGENAANMSASAVSLLKRFFEAGFDAGAALNIINSALMLKSNSEIFATLDLCAVDLERGIAHFIKVGGAVSYIKNGRNVEKVEFSSLPIGILMNVEKKACVKNLNRGSVVVMLTDGISDAFSDEESLISAIKDADGEDAKSIAQTILKAALKAQNGTPKDDMTVLCSLVG